MVRLEMPSLEALFETMRQFIEIAINLRWWCAHDQMTDGSSSEPDVLIRAHQVNLGVGQHNSRFRHVLNGVLRFAVLAGDSTDRSGQVGAFQRLHIVYFERLQEQFVQSEQGERIVHSETEHERLHEIGRLLDGVKRGGLFAFLDLNRSSFGVESDLQFEVFDDRRKQFHPVRS